MARLSAVVSFLMSDQLFLLYGYMYAARINTNGPLMAHCVSVSGGVSAGHFTSLERFTSHLLRSSLLLPLLWTIWIHLAKIVTIITERPLQVSSMQYAKSIL